ncbi:unnamed protein product [Cuscuta epithymum]|uniref:PUM-HD domain-containing protein n=2 Tax=Cuscuta epithymum TaxID=186058 RepID=A0AAV0F9C7_9ASTE|nr:unnamed protein product [Cuscuta epithymum]
MERQWGLRSPYLQGTIPQPPQNPALHRNIMPEVYPNPDILGIESQLSNLRLSSPDYRLPPRHHHPPTIPPGPTADGGELAFGLRSDPVIRYGYDPVMSLGAQNGNADVEGLMMTMRRRRMAHSQDVGTHYSLDLGGPLHDISVGPTRPWAAAVACNGGQTLRNAASASAAAASTSSAQPWMWYDGGGGREHFSSRNSQKFHDGHDPFLLPKKPFVPFQNHLHGLNQNYDHPAGVSSPRNWSVSNGFKPYPNKKEGMNQGGQHFVLLNLEELRGNVVSLAKDQSGCRILQDNLILLGEEGTEIVLSEIIEHVGDMMKNQSGSYLIQKLFSVCSEEQRTNIILALTKKPSQLIPICTNPFGARAMQKLLEELSCPQQRSLVMDALSPWAVTLSCDLNGHLVILYCLKNFSFEYTKKLINELAKNCFGIATNRSGCCVLQSCIENAHGEAKECLVNEIIAYADQLSENPYGNYVVQHLLGQNIPGVEENLLARLQGKFASLACNKYASNVVEKFFLKSGEQSTRIITELISSPNLPLLLIDPFGNYVIQKALKVAKGEAANALVELIMINAQSMQSNMYGKMILACLSRGGRDVYNAARPRGSN